MLVRVVVVYLTLATAFALVTPPFEAPDETGHLFYVNHVARHLALPDQYDEQRSVVGEGHQFPLYYALAALPVRLLLADNSVDLLPVPNQRQTAPGASGRSFPKFHHLEGSIFVSSSDRAAFYGLRFFSILLGCVTVVLTWHIAGYFVDAPRYRALAMLLVATLPQFLFISASVNNDNLVTALASAVILCLFRASDAPERRNMFALGALLGLALLAKKSALFLLPAAGLFFVARWLGNRAEGPALARGAALAGGLVLALSAPVFWRNQALYGDPLGAEMERATLPALVDEKSLSSGYWLDPFLPWFAQSFIGVFGWMNVTLPLAAYLCYAAILTASIAGLIIRLGRAGRPERLSIAFAVAVIGMCLAGIVVYNLTFSQYQGRFLFLVIALIAALTAAGLQAVVVRFVQRRRVEQAILAALGLSLIAIDILSLVVIWRFHYRPDQYL